MTQRRAFQNHRSVSWLLLSCLACSSHDPRLVRPVDEAPPTAGTTPVGPSGALSPAAAGSAAAGTGDAGALATAGARATAGTGATAGGSAGAAAGRDAGEGGMMAAAGSSGREGSAGTGAVSGAGAEAPVTTEKFSFFITSLAGMLELSKSPQGFGGDLRYGEATGLAGADKICTELAEKSLPGAGAKGWHAFLSTAKGGMLDGPIHAKDRIGTGPWYDRRGRLVAMNLTALLLDRPMGADAAIIDDLPNERGEPNHTDTMAGMDDNHDVVTASDVQGMWDQGTTCNDWTSIETPMPEGGGGRFNLFGPKVGHSWPAQSGMSWMSAHSAPGCAPSVALVQTGPGSGTGIGNGGGYGGIYCFAMKP